MPSDILCQIITSIQIGSLNPTIPFIWVVFLRVTLMTLYA